MVPYDGRDYSIANIAPKPREDKPDLIDRVLMYQPTNPVGAVVVDAIKTTALYTYVGLGMLLGGIWERIKGIEDPEPPTITGPDGLEYDFGYWSGAKKTVSPELGLIVSADNMQQAEANRHQSPTTAYGCLTFPFLIFRSVLTGHGLLTDEIMADDPMDTYHQSPSPDACEPAAAEPENGL